MHNCWCSHSARIANICRVTRACWQWHAIVASRWARIVPRRIVGRSKPATPEAPVVWYCHSFFDPHAVADAGPREVSRRNIVETHIVAAQIIDVVEALLNVVDAPRALVEPAHFEYKVWGEGAVYGTASYVATTTFTSTGSSIRYQSMNHAPITTTIFPVYTRRSIPQSPNQI